MNANPCLLLADADLFSLLALMAFAAISLLGKLLGRKKQEPEEEDDSRAGEVVEIRLDELMSVGEPAPRPPPVGRPAPVMRRPPKAPPPPPQVPIVQPKVVQARPPRRAARRARPAPRPADAKTARTGRVQRGYGRQLRSILAAPAPGLRASILVAEVLAPPLALRDPASGSLAPPGLMP